MKLIPLSVLALSTLFLTGCFSVKVSSGKLLSEYTRSETVIWTKFTIEGLDPQVLRLDDGSCRISFDLIGDFVQQVRKEHYQNRGDETWLSMGAFPGALACYGEYDDAVKSGLQACWYNFVFAGLPTLHGLLIEPFNPIVLRQSNSIVGTEAFVRSPLIGFCKYLKSAPNDSRVELGSPVAHKRYSLSGAELSTVGSPVSASGDPLFLPASSLDGVRTVDVRISIPADHPMRSQLAELDRQVVTVVIPKGKGN